MVDRASPSFSVYVSRFVVGECAAGDSVTAADRLRVLAEVPLLEVTTDAESLAAVLLEEVPLPPKAATDALHIAVAAVNGVEYLLTWNCRHIANPALRPRIESVCRRMGVGAPCHLHPAGTSGDRRWKLILSLPKCERFASSWPPVSGSGSPISSKKHSCKILLATEKSSGSHHDAQSPRP